MVIIKRFSSRVATAAAAAARRRDGSRGVAVGGGAPDRYPVAPAPAAASASAAVPQPFTHVSPSRFSSNRYQRRPRGRRNSVSAAFVGCTRPRTRAVGTENPRALPERKSATFDRFKTIPTFPTAPASSRRLRLRPCSVPRGDANFVSRDSADGITSTEIAVCNRYCTS